MGRRIGIRQLVLWLVATCLLNCRTVANKTGSEALDEARQLRFSVAVVDNWTSSDGSSGVRVSFRDPEGLPIALWPVFDGRDPADVMGEIQKRNEHDVRLLGRVHDLRALFLGLRPQSPQSVAVLGGLTRLEVLSLWSRAQDGDMRYVSRLPNLCRLDLQETDVTDAGIAALVGLRNLKDLDLRWTKVTGDCLRHICKMDGIEDLNLSGVPVTDEQLMLLSRLPKLKRLFLHLTGVPEDGIEKLMAASPSLALVGKDGHYYTHDLPLPE